MMRSKHPVRVEAQGAAEWETVGSFRGCCASVVPVSSAGLEIENVSYTIYYFFIH